MNTHFTMRRGAVLGLLPLLPSLLTAQDELAPHAPRELSMGADAFQIPLHECGDGLWACGPDYKVRFDGTRTEFHPVVGAAVPITPTWTWRTVRLGGEVAHEVAGDAPALGGFRFERTWQHDGSAVPVVEAWDVDAEGVEQTFLLTVPPALGGPAFEIVGAVDAPRLAATARGARHEALTWHDADGIDRVGYGAAVAIDARGARLRLDTSWDGEHVRIAVPSAWLHTASYPVLIDPLTSNVALSPDGNRVHEPHIEYGEGANRRVVTYGRLVSGNDWDAYGRMYDSSWTYRGVVLAESDANLSVRSVSTGYVRSTDRFVLAFEEETPALRSIRARVVPGTATNTSDGTEVTISPSIAGRQHGRPVVGGAREGDSALVVYEDDLGVGQDSDTTRIRARMLDTLSYSRGPVLDLSAGGGNSFDAQSPSVSDLDFAGDWAVAWQERNTGLPTDDWDVMVHKVEDDGTLRGRQSYSFPATQGLHKLQPKIAGELNDYVITYLTAVNDGNPVARAGSRVRSLEFSWGSAQAAPSAPRAERILASETTNRLGFGETGDAVAFDDLTESHYVVVWIRSGNLFANEPTLLMASRVGGDGVLETHELESVVSLSPPFGAASTSFERDGQSFLIAYGQTTGGSGNSVRGLVLEHPAAIATPYGPSCNGALSANHRPLAGSRLFRMTLAGAQGNQASWLLAGVAPANFVVPGLSNCPVLLDIQITPILVATDTSTQSGTARFDLPIPNAAAGTNIYWQALQTSLLNVSGLSNGVYTAIR